MSVAARVEGVDLRLGRRFDLSVPELTFGPGVTAVVGTNGSGKTTLLRLVATVLRPDAGTITVGGHDTTTPAGLLATRRLLGYVPQHDTVPAADDRFRPCRPRRRHARGGELDVGAPRVVGRAIRAVGLADVAGERCGRLSGGQRRLVAIAAAFAGDPQLLVLDEPDANLDDDHREDLGRRLRADAATVVLSTHDGQWAAAVADRIVELRDGRVRQSSLRPNHGPAARSPATIAVLVVGDGDGGAAARSARLVEPAEAGERPGPRLVGVGEVEVVEPGRRHESPRTGRRGAGRASPWPSTAWTRDTSHDARAAFSGPRRAARRQWYAAVYARPSRSSTSSGDQVVARRAAPTSSCWPRSPRRRCHSPSASSDRRRRGRPSAGATPLQRAPVSSSDFIESRIQVHPSPTLPTCPG